MRHYVFTYIAIAVVLGTLDFLWLGVIAKSFYRQEIGHLMAAQTNMPAAFLFYAIYPIGLIVFAVAPHAVAGWGKTLLYGAMFGFFVYATYDLTNVATLRNWPIGLSLVDVAWGVLVSAIAAGAGKAAWTSSI